MAYIGPGGLRPYPGYRPQSLRKQAIGKITTGRAFNDLPAIIAAFPDVISAIVAETTEEVAREARATAPIRTGRLRASVKTRYGHRRGDGMVLSGRIDVKARDPERNDPKHLYAWYVEVGTVHTKAQPFLLPAVIANRPVFLGKLGHLESRLPT